MIENYCDISLMIWLASFPRSGNTFFRNVLYEVYGISSSTYHKDPTRQLDDGFAGYPVVKTHLLPDQLPANLQNCKSVYIVRDGRDALVSIAHHRKDIVAPGSDYFNNLLLATLALNDSYFGGWSSNVEAWISKADIIIKFEDLIRDPIGEISKLSAILELPPPNLNKLPDFKTLKFGSPQYGSGGKDFKVKNLAQKHFRKGQVGGYKTEMSVELQQLFWDLHGPAMHQQGYITEKMQPSSDKPKKKILLEVSKALTDDNDGVKRYLLELIEHLTVFATLRSDFQIDLLYNEIIRPLHQAKNIGSIGADLSQENEDKAHSLDQMRNAFIQTKNHGYEYYLLRAKAFVQQVLPKKIYQSISEFYRAGPFRRLLTTLRMKITFLKQESIRRDNQKLLNSYDLVHAPLPQHMYLIDHIKAKYLVTTHDFTHQILPEYHTENNIKLSEDGMKRALKNNAHFIAISNATANDLNKLYQVPSERTKVIYEGANGNFRLTDKAAATILQKYGVSGEDKYFMSLSTIEPRKNIKGTLLAFQLLRELFPTSNVKLLIGGKKGWKYDNLPIEEEALAEKGIFFTGFIPDDELPVLYNNAIALCYLSHYEGFGLPLLEAMQSGTTVIYGNNSSMPEVVGEGGLGVDTNDTKAIAAAMQLLLENPVLRADLIKKAQVQSYKFSWLKAAFETMNYYEEVISSPASI
jgi:glycosyltransferase involved in cell wall biosynthesis